MAQILSYFFIVYGIICFLMFLFEVVSTKKNPGKTFVLLPYKNDQEKIEGKIYDIFSFGYLNPCVLAVDTGSCDNTKDLLFTLSEKYENIHITTFESLKSTLEDLNYDGETNRHC